MTNRVAPLSSEPITSYPRRPLLPPGTRVQTASATFRDRPPMPLIGSPSNALNWPMTHTLRNALTNACG